jgi:hypothetical protein
MKYAVEMGSVAMIHIPRFMEGRFTDTHTAWTLH